VSSQGVAAPVHERSYLTNHALGLLRYSRGSCSYFLSRTDELLVSNPNKIAMGQHEEIRQPQKVSKAFANYDPAWNGSCRR
jgi:hypothetical protein